MTQVVSLKKANAIVAETIALNETQSELDKAKFEFETKILALNVRYQEERDKIRLEFHQRLAEITS